MATWTTADDVTDSWIGADAPTDMALVGLWVDRAERLVRGRVPSLVARIASGDEPDLLDTVKDVVSSMVQRVFRNPEGIRQTNETTGPFTESRTYGGDVPGGLDMTPAELAALTRGETGRQRAYEIDPLAGYVNPWGATWPSL
jgi:hypothetical protein